MKKVLVILSLIGFVAVNVSVAQTPQATTEVKKETTVAKSDAKPAMKACCSSKSGSMKNCSTAEMKNCTPEQKAACAKGGTAKAGCSHDHKAKAEAVPTEIKQEEKINN